MDFKCKKRIDFSAKFSGPETRGIYAESTDGSCINLDVSNNFEITARVGGNNTYSKQITPRSYPQCPDAKSAKCRALSSVSRSQKLLDANYFNEFRAGSFSRKRVPRERGVGGPAGDRRGNTGLGDRNPGGPRRVPEHLPIRVDHRGSLLLGDRTNVGRNRRGKLRTSVSACRKVSGNRERLG